MKHNTLRACGIILTAAIVLASTAIAQTACKVAYTISPQNASAFGAAITIENTGTTAWTSWTLTWAFANGQTITSLWNGTETQSGASVTVKNLSYNGSIAPGGSIAGIGFNGTWNGSTNAVPSFLRSQWSHLRWRDGRLHANSISSFNDNHSGWRRNRHHQCDRLRWIYRPSYTVRIGTS